MLKIENRGSHGTGSENHLISISCWVLLKVLSDPLSKLFGGLVNAFP